MENTFHNRIAFSSISHFIILLNWCDFSLALQFSIRIFFSSIFFHLEHFLHIPIRRSNIEIFIFIEIVLCYMTCSNICLFFLFFFYLFLLFLWILVVVFFYFRQFVMFPSYILLLARVLIHLLEQRHFMIRHDTHPYTHTEGLISTETFCRIFPFHVMFDRHMQIVQVGKSVSRIIPR